MNSEPTSIADAIGKTTTPARWVKCMDCGKNTECDGYTWDLAKLFCKELAKRGEKILQNGGIVRCDDCSAKYRTAQGVEANETCHRITSLRRQLRKQYDKTAAGHLEEIDPGEATDKFMRSILRSQDKYSSRKGAPT